MYKILLDVHCVKCNDKKKDVHIVFNSLSKEIFTFNCEHFELKFKLAEDKNNVELDYLCRKCKKNGTYRKIILEENITNYGECCENNKVLFNIRKEFDKEDNEI